MLVSELSMVMENNTVRVRRSVTPMLSQVLHPQSHLMYTVQLYIPPGQLMSDNIAERRGSRHASRDSQTHHGALTCIVGRWPPLSIIW